MVNYEELIKKGDVFKSLNSGKEWVIESRSIITTNEYGAVIQMLVKCDQSNQSGKLEVAVKDFLQKNYKTHVECEHIRNGMILNRGLYNEVDLSLYYFLAQLPLEEDQKENTENKFCCPVCYSNNVGFGPGLCNECLDCANRWW